MRKLLILLSAVAFVVAFTLPAAAADWGFYGSSRMTTFYDSVSEEKAASGYDDSDLTWGLQGNSRIGANVKTDGPISGGFEYGSGPNLRKLFGTLKVGAGSLLVGQTYTPVNMFYSHQVWGGDTNMLKFGGVYDGRRPMLQYAQGPFKVALIEPSTGAVTGPADTDTTMPKLEAAYKFNAGPAGLAVAFGYNSYDEVDANDDSESISSYFLGLGFNMDFAPAYVKGDIYMGQNLAQFGLWQEGDASAGVDAGGDIEDNDSLGYLLVLGYKVNPKMILELGYGANQHDRDSFDEADDTSAYYIQMTYNLAKGAYIVPEIGMVDFGDSSAGTDQGDTTYFGAKWQINF